MLTSSILILHGFDCVDQHGTAEPFAAQGMEAVPQQLNIRTQQLGRKHAWQTHAPQTKPIQYIHLAQWMTLRLVLAETRPQAPAGKQDEAGQGCRLTVAQDIGRILHCTTLVFLSLSR